ncbi:DUF732 domain-containing protein [Hoyosella sp. G463]|uniref:DUF732 domain-containing protein n=1 Tax=Lolliginicoccus lacisalsi TaxID=2742202 RepID=A0A927JCU6_9ACTN|nr:DUF732 domain-containing protein [Lolliginicoccus lacisalsi]MBD8506936.1 DUF732 domain-containing protein [Lolliginicoccus lacisalsi]
MTARTWWAAALAAASIATLGACSDEAVVASDPVVVTPEATASDEAEPSDAAPSETARDEAPEAPGETSEAPAGTGQDSPEGGAPAAADPLDEYLGAVGAAGLPAGPQASSALDIGAYVCAAGRDGLTRESILINVTAMVGLELQRIGSEADPERIADEYVEIAGRHYCDG